MTGIFTPNKGIAKPLQEIGTRTDSAYKTGSLGPRHRSGSLGLVTTVLPNYTRLSGFGAIVSVLPNYTPLSGAMGALGATTLSSVQVQSIQQQINAVLSANGYNPISVDGKLGPATCGAAMYLQQQNLATIYIDNGLSDYCTAWTNPTLNGQSSPAQTTINQALDVATAQQQINAALQAAGMAPIAVDSTLGPATCGAMQWMKQTTGQDLLSTVGASCGSFIPPTPLPVEALAPSLAPQGTPPPAAAAPTAPTPPATHPITSATMLAGGLAIAALGGLYYLAKKKGLV
jgi:hypothetical protein